MSIIVLCFSFDSFSKLWDKLRRFNNGVMIIQIGLGEQC